LNGEPIDAVIAWVDGADPQHAARLAEYLAGMGGARPAAAHSTRFHDAGEIDWCVVSILRYAPWIRTIHIVTDRQTPTLVARLRGTPFAARVRVVDHREIFAGYEDCLPTFNSRSISSLFWRIPGIAPRYIYFNDDFVLLRPVRPDDFFRNGHVVVHGRWEKQAHARWVKRLMRWLGSERQADHNPTESRAQDLSARLVGFDRRCFRLEHCPYPMRAATLAGYFAAHPDLLHETIVHRLRHPAQLRPESLAAHLELMQGGAVLDEHLRLVQIKPAEQGFARLRRKLARADRDPRVAFACVQSLDLAPPRVREHLIGWLNWRVGRLAQLVADAQATVG
jgi:hypothetical protein